MEFRIGDRDPTTGLYYVIYPDGSQTLNGMKIFNAVHQVGDVVRATQRSDGMMALDSVKAFEVPTTDKSISVKDLGKQPVGYLQGQVFNDEQEKTIEYVTIRCSAIYDNVAFFDENTGQTTYGIIRSRMWFALTIDGNQVAAHGDTGFYSFDCLQIVGGTGGGYPLAGTLCHDRLGGRGGGGVYEMQINLKKWEGVLQIHCIPLVDENASLPGAPPDRCELEYELAQYQKPIPMSRADLKAITLGSGRISKNSSEFFQEAFQLPAAGSLIPTPPTAFVVTCNKRTGKISVT